MFSRTISRLSLTARVAVVIVAANLTGLGVTTWLSWSTELSTSLERAESEWTKATAQFGATAEGAVKWKKASVIQEAYAMYRDQPKLGLNAFLAVNAKKEEADAWALAPDAKKSFAERALAIIDKAPEAPVVDKSTRGEMLVVSPLGLDKAGKRIGLQCKLYGGPVGNKAVQEAHAGKVFYGVDAAGVLTNASFTPSAVTLALATGVKLFSQHDIPDLFEKTFVAP